MEEMNYYIPNEQPEEHKPKKAGSVIALALCFSLLGGVLGSSGVLVAQWLMDDSEDTTLSQGSQGTVIYEGERPTATINIEELDTSKVMTAAEVYAANVNSTVGITTTTTTNFWGHTSTSAASGSGFIITSDGYILTNYHVVEGSDQITVALYDGQEYEAALIGYDDSNDIAVLKIQAEGLAPVVLGDSDQLNVGDDVVAIGNPLGELTFSLTAGKVSAKDRQVTFSDSTTMELIQTDCAINSGNSGGALFNMYGEVIGVTNAKYSGSSSSGATIDNIGFAIPINDIRDIVESIIEKGYVSKAYLGVSVTDVTQDFQIYGLPQGAVVRQVEEDSPAQRAGLEIGDIITQVGGQEVSGADDLVAQIADSQPGDQLKLTVYRQGMTVELTVTLEEQIQGQG